MTNENIKIIRNSVILITGGTGSFGHTVVGKLLSLSPKKIIVFSRDEKKQFDMRNEFDNPTLRFVIGDTRDKEQVFKVMKGVDYVFHAAALKQVPTCEFFPMEAIKTNIIGAYNVLNAALAQHVKRVVFLSTDKAVYPINVMGMSKALMEKIMLAEARMLAEIEKNTTVFCCVRYGNVLYTRGSVVPYFVNLIKQNKVLTVTNSDMTRFLLPLSEAVDLVLFALANGENGFTYVRKSPACTIKTLAEALCSIFKYPKGFTEVGIRAGEKMHETLIAQEESFRALQGKKYYMIPSESQGLDYNKYFFRGTKNKIAKFEPFTSENTRRLDIKETIKMLMDLPEIKKELKLMKKDH